MGVGGCDCPHATGARLRPTMGRGAPSWPTENVAALVKRALLRLDTRLAAQAAPLLLLRTDEGRELLRRVRSRIGAARAQLLAHLGCVVRAHELPMQPLHDTRWRAGRDEDAVPDDRLEARASGLGGRRHVGPSGGAFAASRAAMRPFAPVRFSTITGWPKASASLAAICLARMSGELPATDGTRILSARAGKVCAAAVPQHNAAAKATSFDRRRIGNFLASRAS